MSTDLCPDITDCHRRVRLALRFGWTLAEVYGRFEQKPPPDTQPKTPTLFLSRSKLSPSEFLWSAVLRLIYLSKELFAPFTASGDTDNRDGLDVLPGCPTGLRELVETMEGRMPGNARLPKERALLDEVDRWSRQIWGLLDAEEPLVAGAARLGAVLADAFHSWPYPQPRKSEEGNPTGGGEMGWKTELNSDRLTDAVRQVRLVEHCLSPHVGPILRHSLWEWSIAGELTRSKAGQLQIAFPFLYHLRGWGLVRRWRERKKTTVPILQSLSLDEERSLWRYFSNQMATWELLISDRPVAQLLVPGDWRCVRLWAFGLFVVALLVCFAAACFGLYILLSLLFQCLSMVPAFPKFSGSVDEQLALIAAVFGALGFLAGLLHEGWAWAGRLRKSIFDWVILRKLTQRGLRSWDGRGKPLGLIWLQRIFRAQD